MSLNTYILNDCTPSSTKPMLWAELPFVKEVDATLVHVRLVLQLGPALQVRRELFSDY